MHRFILALMIVLLPLRGWAGDVMAMEMAAGTLAESSSAIESVANNPHSAGTAGLSDAKNTAQPDCPDHAAAPDDTAHAASDCHTCADCRICHTLALTPTLAQLAPAAVPAAQPQTAAPDFASAERAPGFKPPIS